MYQALLTLAIVGYVIATGLAVAFLVQGDELIHRLASLATLAGWILHTVALLTLALDLGRPPLGSLPEALLVAVWVVVLVEMWLERRYGLPVLGAFVLPVALAFSLQSMPMRPLIGSTLRGAWVWVHILLALIGIAAFVLNFAGALMYLLQERQLKTKRPGALYYRLPALETLDRLTYRTLALGFPFLTTGLILGVLWAGAAWGSVFAFDPLALMSFFAWAVYAATLAGRAAAGWHGRRAAYFAILGFAVLPLPLAAGLFLPGRRGSGPARVPGGVQPRLDDARRAADPGAGEGRVRACPDVRDGRPRAPHPVHAGVRRRQEGAHGDGDRAPRGVRLVRRGRAGEEDLHGARRQGGPPRRRGQDERARRPTSCRARRVSDLRQQPDLGPGAGDGPGAVRHRRALRRAGDRPGGGRHRDHLHRRAGAGDHPRDGPADHPRAARATALLHRHRGPARRRGLGRHAGRRVLLRHRRSEAGRRRQHPGARPRSPAGRGAR